jgi:integrase
MSVKVRPYRKRGENRGWEVDIVLKLPSGEAVRERVKAPVSSKGAAKDWGLQRELVLLQQGGRRPNDSGPRQVVTLGEFWPRFLEGYCRANRQKPSTLNEKGKVMDYYLRPRFGDRPLDAITNESIQRLKGELADLAPKTVNNVLSLLGTTLRVAVDWGVIAAMPARIKLLRTPPGEMAFYEPFDFERLVVGAGAVGREVQVLVLLGGEAGLRCGEILGLEWTDVDFARGHLTVQRAVWRGHVTLPKGGRSRRVPLTERLARVLRAHRHLAGVRVLVGEGGAELRRVDLRAWMAKAQRRAGLEVNSLLRILRHTFCSRLAIAGAPAKAIQELAGHVSLSTTQRYMHLSPAAKDAAIRLLENASLTGENLGDMLETTRGLSGRPRGDA